MKILIAILSIFILASCGEGTQKSELTNVRVSTYGFEMAVFETNIKGCQYFVYDRSLTHRGDCNNPIHMHVDTVFCDTLFVYEKKN